MKKFLWNLVCSPVVLLGFCLVLFLLSFGALAMGTLMKWAAFLFLFAAVIAFITGRAGRRE